MPGLPRPVKAQRAHLACGGRMPNTQPVHSPSGPGFRAIIRTRARDWDRRASPLHAFGGRPLLDAELPVVAVTGRPLHLAFDFDLSDPRLAGLRISSLRRLAILAPFGIDLGRRGSLAIRHLDGGRRLELAGELKGRVIDDAPELPQLPVELEALSAAEESVETADEMPEGTRALHQVGGNPVWMRAPLAPPPCPVTGDPMRFIVSVASIRRFPLSDDDVELARRVRPGGDPRAALNSGLD